MGGCPILGSGTCQRQHAVDCTWGPGRHSKTAVSSRAVGRGHAPLPRSLLFLCRLDPGVPTSQRRCVWPCVCSPHPHRTLHHPSIHPPRYLYRVRGCLTLLSMVGAWTRVPCCCLPNRFPCPLFGVPVWSRGCARGSGAGMESLASDAWVALDSVKCVGALPEALSSTQPLGFTVEYSVEGECGQGLDQGSRDPGLGRGVWHITCSGSLQLSLWLLTLQRLLAPDVVSPEALKHLAWAQPAGSTHHLDNDPGPQGGQGGALDPGSRQGAAQAGTQGGLLVPPPPLPPPPPLEPGCEAGQDVVGSPSRGDLSQASGPVAGAGAGAGAPPSATAAATTAATAATPGTVPASGQWEAGLGSPLARGGAPALPHPPLSHLGASVDGGGSDGGGGGDGGSDLDAVPRGPSRPASGLPEGPGAQGGGGGEGGGDSSGGSGGVYGDGGDGTGAGTGPGVPAHPRADTGASDGLGGPRSPPPQARSAVGAAAAGAGAAPSDPRPRTSLARLVLAPPALALPGSPVTPLSPSVSSHGPSPGAGGASPLVSPRAGVESLSGRAKRSSTLPSVEEALTRRASVAPGQTPSGEDPPGEEGVDSESTAVLSTEGEGEPGPTLLRVTCALSLCVGDLLRLIAQELRVPYEPPDTPVGGAPGMWGWV